MSNPAGDLTLRVGIVVEPLVRALDDDRAFGRGLRLDRLGSIARPFSKAGKERT
jgi:hypothetical protein